MKEVHEMQIGGIIQQNNNEEEPAVDGSQPPDSLLLIKQYVMISLNAECIVFSNGQAAYLVDDYFFYLNDLIYCPKYQEMAVFNVVSQQLKVKLKDILQHQEMFMPIDSLQVKHVVVKSENVTVISTVVRNYLFLFQANSTSCELFFVFEYNKDQKIEHVKMRKESEKLLILVVLSA